MVGEPIVSLQVATLNQVTRGVEEIIGSGSNRLVAKCRKVGTDKIVVIKVFRKKNHLAAINEVCDINRLSILGANKNSVPTFIDNFIYKDCICLVFELLHLNLCDFLQRQRWKPMSVADIKLIALQMLIFLRTLKRIGLTHADIKPSNIMLVNQESQPFKVKLTGFGLALETATLSEFAKVQAVGYRAPEVYMGLPYNESIDMWSLGCTLVFMYLRSRDFFKRTEYEEITIPTLHPFYERLQSLDDLEIMAPDTRTLNEKKEIKAFVQLVKRMLKLNPADRILPDDALKHPFFSMGAYPQSFKSCTKPSINR
uniref:Protein kinase domain-containing protein n=1 Tax=Nothobranchius furzeri TaxID=105023 RepID=A0A8C6KTU2_NOTFU